MQRLAEFVRIAYDTNCLVYYCFEVNIPESNPQRTIRGELTERTRVITERLKEQGKQITTIQKAFWELNDCIHTAVVDELATPRAKALLGITPDKPIPDMIQHRVQAAVKKHATKLENKSWFVIDRAFKASPASFQTLRAFFDSIPPEELNGAERASAVDIELVHFGFAHQIPLVTNDGGIYRCTSRLQNAGLAFRIYGLKQLSV